MQIGAGGIVVITSLAVHGYRSLRDVRVALAPLTVITGSNGSGKSSLYRALRLLADVGQGRLIASLAAEGGLTSTLWAGPERISRAMRTGDVPVQGTARREPVSLRLGFAADDYGYALDLGLPIPSGSRFTHDPEIKVEQLWTGALPGRSNVFAERRGGVVRVRSQETGSWRTVFDRLARHDSMLALADPVDGLELLMLRERLRGWRFYDDLRTDAHAPCRHPGVGTFTPVLASDGADLGAAVQTILEIGDAAGLQAAVDDAFPGSSVTVDDRFLLAMRQHGLLRPLSAPELSGGTLRYLLLAAALYSPRPPELMVLNEPEASLHRDLVAPLARLIVAAGTRCQIVVVTHSAQLAAQLADAGAGLVGLEKDFGETQVQDDASAPWRWPTR